MAFIKLTKGVQGDSDVALNSNMIIGMVVYDGDSFTTIKSVNDLFSRVKETPEEILRMIKEE